MPRSCPPGVLCLSSGWITFFVILCTVLVCTFFFLSRGGAPTIIMAREPPSNGPITMIQKGGDSRYERAPLPLRDWMAPPEMSSRRPMLPFNIPTQGLPETFQSVGIINVGEQI